MRFLKHFELRVDNFAVQLFTGREVRPLIAAIVGVQNDLEVLALLFAEQALADHVDFGPFGRLAVIRIGGRLL